MGEPRLAPCARHSRDRPQSCETQASPRCQPAPARAPSWHSPSPPPWSSPPRARTWTSPRSSRRTRSPSTPGISTTGARAVQHQLPSRSLRLLLSPPFPRLSPSCAHACPRSRVFVALLSGATSGIMGLEGLVGFAAFFLSTMLLSLGMYLKTNSDPRPYFKKSGDVWGEGVGQAMMVRRGEHGAPQRAPPQPSERSIATFSSARRPAPPLTHGTRARTDVRAILDTILRHRAHLLIAPARRPCVCCMADAALARRTAQAGHGARRPRAHRAAAPSCVDS